MKTTTTFWTRNGFSPLAREACFLLLDGHVRAREEKRRNERCCGAEVDVGVKELKPEEQGYCSYTYLCTTTTINAGQETTSTSTSTSTIIQLRLPAHTFNLSIAAEAQRVYGSELVPWVAELKGLEFPGGMRGFEMERVRGLGLGVLLRRMGQGGTNWGKNVRLMESFAKVVARAWHSAWSDSTTKTCESERDGRADSPISSIPSRPEWLSRCGGVVGRNIVSKLDRLTRELPYEGLRQRAKDTLERLMGMSDYPLVLNHGDLIPSNILVDAETWEVKGLVDWAEAEVLPFGTCLYGVEYILGKLVYPTMSSLGDGKRGPVFEYCEGADELRRIFWRSLIEGKPDLEKRLGEVKVMRDLGVLLWEGFAWDEGRIDRVVDEVNDVEEMARLRAFLSV